MAKASYQVRNIERGFWTYDLYLPGRPPFYSVGEVHGDEREARRRAKRALAAEEAEGAARRCETNICGGRGECLRCGADNGEVCRAGMT